MAKANGTKATETAKQLKDRLAREERLAKLEEVETPVIQEEETPAGPTAEPKVKVEEEPKVMKYECVRGEALFYQVSKIVDFMNFGLHPARIKPVLDSKQTYRGYHFRTIQEEV